MSNWVVRCGLGLALGLAVLAPAAAALAQSEPLIPVKATIIAPGSNYSQLAIAKDEGIFAKHGLDVEFVTVDTANSGIASAVSGATQFTFTGPNLVDAVVAGIPIVAVFAIDNVSIAQVCTKTEVNSAQDLVGKIVGVPNRGSAPDVTFRIWLRDQGLDDTQVTIRNINTGTPGVMAAAAAGQIDAFALNPPRCYMNESAGFKVLADLGSSGMPYFNAGIAVSKDYLTNSRETVKKFVAALEEARQLFKDNKEIAFKAISGQDKITDTAILEQVWAFYNQYWANPGTVSADALMRAVQESSAEATRQGGEALVSSMYDNSVVEDVIAGN